MPILTIPQPTQNGASGSGAAPTQLRAHRWGPLDVPWISRVSLASGQALHVLNISSTGLLVASPTPYVPGRATVFRLWGPDLDLTVSARIVRSRADAASHDLRYQVAARFDGPIARIPPVLMGRPLSRSASSGLTNLITSVNGAAARRDEPGAWQRAFETGLKRLIPAHAVGICDGPRPHAEGLEAVYFTVLTEHPPYPVLQATFEAAHPLRKDEFELLEGAAVVAADVIELDETRRREGDGFAGR